MVIATAKDLAKEYGTDVILSGVSFQVQEGDRIGIVGPNGAGKTTLLRLLTGELMADEGSFQTAKDVTIGYLKQQADLDSDKTVIGEVESRFTHLDEMEARLHEISDAIPKAEGDEQQRLIRQYDELSEEYKAKGGFTYKSEIRGILTSMAFLEDRWDQKIRDLSGGEKTRLALALLLLEKPDILLLDEPTNHLDIGTLQWLEQYLKGYRKTLMVVSHDRYFLDQVVSRIFDVDNQTLTVYEGNYTSYAHKKALRREEEQRRWEAYERERAKQEDIVRRFKQRGTEKLAKRARSREIKLDKMEEVKRPTGQHGRMKIRFKERYESGNDVLLVEDLAKSYGAGQDRVDLFEHVDLDIKRGERVCMVGRNGIGKTTLLKILMGQVPKDSGRVRLGHNVKIAYYDQEQRLLRDDLTVLEEVQEEYGMYTATELRPILGSFLFRGDDVFLPVGSLSGGEKARLALLKLMMSGGNLLLLDEPTNHLDIESREVFEDALMDFPGTVLVISHDRYFLNKVPTRIVELEEDGLVNYLGKYDYYTEKKQEIKSGRKYMETLRGAAGGSADPAGVSDAAGAGMSGVEDSANSEVDPGAVSGQGGDSMNTSNLSAAEERQLKKQQEAEERKARREKESLEKEIDSLEKTIADLTALMCTEEVLADHVRLTALDAECREARERLDEAYEKWLQYE